MHGRTRGLLVGLVAALLLSGCSSGFNERSATEESMATVGNPMQPLSAQQADQTTPPVRGGDPVHSWNELNEQHGDDKDFVQCVERRLDINWKTKVPSLIEQEKKPVNGFTIIVALNVDRDPQWVRDFARENEGAAGVTDDTPVLYTSRIDNTMTDGCAPFDDKKRSTITVVDVVPNTTSEKGNPSLDRAKPIKGFMNRCKNPVIIPPGSSPKPSPTPSASDSPSPSASTSPNPSGSTSPPPSGTPTPSLETKIPSQNPGVGNGTGNNEGLGDKTTPSQPGKPPREDPPEPEADTPKAPTVTSTPRPAGSATPTVDPGGQDNDGVVDPDDCAIC